MNASPVDPLVDRLPTIWAPPAPRRRRGRRILRAVGVFTLAMVITAVGTTGVLAHQTIQFRSAYEGLILPGAVVAGVDVGGMGPDAALDAVREVVEPELDHAVTVRWGEHEWTTTARDLASTHDAEDAVAGAVAVGERLEFDDLYRMRWHEDLLDYTADVTVSHSPEAVRAWVDEIAEEVDRDPRDASMDHSSGWVEVASHRVGYRTDVDAAHAAVMDALANGTEDVDLQVARLEPDVTADEFAQVLLLRQHEHQLYLYQDGEITHSWPVAVGAAASGYPTPRGEYEVTLKRYMPTWVNPDPNGWGANMPARIGPGANNPLGVRALNWSIGAIRFHGTSNVNSIGRNASKGCVRLTNSDVIELYELVDEGATIVSL